MDKQTAKLVARIAENLPDINPTIIQKWIDHPRGLQSFLQGLCKPVTHLTKVWFTVKLGTGLKTCEDFDKAFKNVGYGRDTAAFRILLELGKTYEVSPKPADLRLMIVTPEEMGINESRQLKGIYSIAKDTGLDLCPAEVGPQLCLQYRGTLPELLIGMEPVLNSSGQPIIFHVSAVSLGGLDAETFFEPDWKFVFVAPAALAH